MVASLAMVASQGGALGQRTLALAGQSSFSDFNYIQWLGMKHYKRLYGIRVTNALRVIDLVAQGL